MNVRLGRASLVVGTVLLLAGALPARAEDEAAVQVREAIVAAAGAHDAKALGKALDQANALVGPSATFPDTGALADWLGNLPDPAVRLVDVAMRRAWLYVTAKRGEDAVGPLTAVLAVDAKNAVARSYLGEVKRLAGDTDGAVQAFVQALADGASDDRVLPSVRRLVYDLHAAQKSGEAEGLPVYASVAARFTALRWMPDQMQAVVEWLVFDAEQERIAGHAAEQAKEAEKAKKHVDRRRLLLAEAVRQAWTLLQRPGDYGEPAELARLAYDAAGWVEAAGPSLAAGSPERFDLLAASVRLGETAEKDRPEIPEALSALAAEALAKGRYVLAANLARRRLSISDSPAARRVLLALPPDVGE